MNALQRLIHDYLKDRPDESYASIARRGGFTNRQSVQSVATREQTKQSVRKSTIDKLVLGMPEIPEQVIRAAAAAFDEEASIETWTSEDDTDLMLIAYARGLDRRRKDELIERARFLMNEMRTEGEAGSAG